MKFFWGGSFFFGLYAVDMISHQAHSFHCCSGKPFDSAFVPTVMCINLLAFFIIELRFSPPGGTGGFSTPVTPNKFARGQIA